MFNDKRIKVLEKKVELLQDSLDKMFDLIKTSNKGFYEIIDGININLVETSKVLGNHKKIMLLLSGNTTIEPNSLKNLLKELKSK